MAELGQNQAALDEAVAELNVALGNIEAEVAELKLQGGAEDLDFSALDAAVDRLEFTTTVDEDAVVEPPVEP